jgi:secreted PhoX family phosphatase
MNTKHLDELVDVVRDDRRRKFLRGGLAAAAATVLPWELIGAGKAVAATLPYSPDYGPLADVVDPNTGVPLLRLPEGFTYKSYGWTGDPMNGGIATPGSHDGMGVCGQDQNRIILVRNHEQSDTGGSFAPAKISYDPPATGGTTSLAFDPRTGNFLSAWASIGGTYNNCAGGPTPWGSWLTCEETTAGPSATSALTKPHGYVFEVPAFGSASTQPLTAMGRFSHEAAATDPATSIVYMTEDADSCGFYRFIPSVRGRLAQGGVLQMLKVLGTNQADLRGTPASGLIPAGTVYDVEWVTIGTPDPATPTGATSVFRQGFDLNGARFRKGEGCWYGNGVIWWISSTGGIVGRGQVWKYDPRAQTLTMVYESSAAAVLDSPDNCAWSPRGSLLLCEDGSSLPQRLRGLTPDGTIFPFCENNVDLTTTPVKGFDRDYRREEFAGATFWNEWLFVNIQDPGITFAITGPWDNGAL